MVADLYTNCRHFQNSPHNRRHCPFGRNCFYQHLNADGTPYVFPENSNVNIFFSVYFRHDVLTKAIFLLDLADMSTQPHRWIRARDLDDLSASLERLRRSIPEVFGNDAAQTEQQRRLVDLVSFTYPHHLLSGIVLLPHPPSGVGCWKDFDSVQLPSS